ncbi:hypothetical protein FUAX_02870 [Fulvitalea axinellae]|uniref:Endonuclease/exonuclease/phosphatase domain-containing protein n=1 Tax=Fulvitalea axinellae TaxID=1182444 RepID=A0AAU9DAG4_9BACT|nr:hypothetical protein FUAX_02870 [Fulvitalea axinellae]
MKRILYLLALTPLIMFLASCDDSGTDPTPSKPIDDNNFSKGVYGVYWNLTPCLPVSQDTKLDIATFNLWNFPLRDGDVPWNSNDVDTTRTNHVADIILKSEWDLVALQEVSSSHELNRLLAKLPGWKFSARWNEFDDKQALAFIYNADELELSGTDYIPDSKTANFTSDRNPIYGTFRHKASGKDYLIVDLHFKAKGRGGDTSSQRRAEAKGVKEFVDANYPNSRVIILGDWNDTLSEDTFDVFLSDKENYRFADQNIEDGSSNNWSWRGRSHIDHILISNELFDETENANTASFNCVQNTYYSKVSDHRPVYTSFN